MEREDLFEKLATRCWYCGAEMSRMASDGKRVRVVVRDSRNLFPDYPDFGANACKSCASGRAGHSLREYRARLADRRARKLLSESVALAKENRNDPAAIQALAGKLADASEYLFYIERLFHGLEDDQQ